MPGADYHYYGVSYSDPHLCEASCNGDTVCKAWVYVGKSTGSTGTTGMTTDADGYPIPRCCLKNAITRIVASPTCTAGVKPTAAQKAHVAALVAASAAGPAEAPPASTAWSLTINTSLSGEVPGHEQRYPVASKTFLVLDSEPAISLRVVLDRSVVEAFAQGGRAVVTATAYAKAADSGAGVFATFGGAGGATEAPVVVHNAAAHQMGCTWVDAI